MLVYTIDRTLDGVLSAVFDAFSLHQQPEMLIGKGEPLPLFCEEVHEVMTADDRAQRVWAGLEKRVSKEAMKLLAVSYLSEMPELDTPLFQYICKVFRQAEGARSIERNFSDPDVLTVTNIFRKVMHERLRMMQFVRLEGEGWNVFGCGVARPQCAAFGGASLPRPLWHPTLAPLRCQAQIWLLLRPAGGDAHHVPG